MNHTPGPWKRIAIGKRQVISSRHGWLVELPKRGEPETELQAKQLEADYDLMAAAPELLEALKAIKEAYLTIEKNLLGTAWAKLNRAVDKAEGRTVETRVGHP